MEETTVKKVEELKGKTLTRTMVSGYVYNVMEKKGTSLELVKEITLPAVIRSIKQQKQILLDNQLPASNVLVLNRTLSTKYEMLESDFIKYSKVVTEVVPEPQA